MMKMIPTVQMNSRSGTEYRVHSPQCGSFLMALSRGEAVVYCGVCRKNKKAIIRGGRVTVFELAEAVENCGEKPVASGRNAGKKR